MTRKLDLSPAEEKHQPLADLPLRAVLADNSGPLTGPGTTTWLLGRGEVTVIDPGPALPAHLAAILAALSPGERIVSILVTHPHLDHTALVPALARATGAPVSGFGPPGAGRSPQMQELAGAGILCGEGLDHEFRPDIRLGHGDQICLGGETIRVLHTPGHSAEHLCFAWRDTLFCGDQVMAWAPSLISLPDGNMGDYMASLRALGAEDWRCLIPTHGEVITAPKQRIAALLSHRLAREAKIMAALEAGPATPDELLPVIYADTDPGLWVPARRNLLAHLEDLITRKHVSAENWPGPAPRVTLK